MNETYQSGSYSTYNPKNPYSKLSTKAKHTQNKYQKVAGKLVVGLILLGVVALALFIISAVNNGNLSTLRLEYQNYINMIERAKSNSEYETTAEITGRFYDSEYNAYYLEYDIEYHFFFDPIPGKTPAVFEMDDLNEKYQVGTTIRVALSDKFEHIDRYTDSIIMDLEDIELDDYLDYEDTEEAMETTLTIAIICLIVGAVLVVVIIALYIKGKKVKQTAKANNTSPSITNTPKDQFVCEYCGTHMGLQSKCPNCGAPKR